MNEYPIRLEIAPAAAQSRFTVFIRIAMIIPHAIILYALGAAQQVVTFIAWFAIMFTGKYPAGLFGFSVGVSRWQTRVTAYFLLLTGVYPPFALDDAVDYPIKFSVDDAFSGRNRLTTFFRIFMLIPQLIVLMFVLVAAEFILFFAWVAALVTGKVPEGMHTFVAGAMRWMARFNAYANLLTDKYPPFSLT
ncbi:MAG: DUF4389 domain-containing protein [Dehalococcoidia bacterium]